MLAAFLTTILFSVSAICGNRTARLLGGTEANFWRLVFATLLLAIYAHALGPGLTGTAFPAFFVSGCIGFGIGDVALFQALPRLGSRLSLLLVVCLSAPIAALVEWLWLKSTLSTSQILCGLVVLAGVALALTPRHLPKSVYGKPGTGILFGLAAAICQALGAVLSRHGFAVAREAEEHIDGIAAAYQRILGGVLVTGICLLIVKRRVVWNMLASLKHGVKAGQSADRREVWRRAWPLVLLNGLAGPALGVSCYQWALKTTPTGIVLPIVAITPLVIIPFSHYLEDERPTARSLAGGLIAVAGAVALAIAVHR